MRKVKTMYDDLIDGHDLSDEKIYAIYQFLENLTLNFESKNYCQLARYSKKIKEEIDISYLGIPDDELF